jgi:hypothetical protein
VEKARPTNCEQGRQAEDFGFQPPSRLEAVVQHTDDGNCNHSAIMSDSLLTASPMDGVFGSDKCLSLNLLVVVEWTEWSYIGR